MDYRKSAETQYTKSSINTLSDDEDDYLDTCPIFHDVDSQSIYGFDIIQPMRKSEEILWKDCEFKVSLEDSNIKLKALVFSKLQISNS